MELYAVIECIGQIQRLEKKKYDKIMFCFEKPTYN